MNEVGRILPFIPAVLAGYLAVSYTHLGPHADNIRSLFGTFSYPAVIDMTMSREEDGQDFEEPGVIIYDIDQEYIGPVSYTHL